MTSTNAYCGTCDTPIYNEPSDNRQPCPKCAALNRRFAVSVHEVCHASDTVQLAVTTYPQKLLGTARGLMESGEYGIAIVVAHMACEVAAERTISEALRSKSDVDLEKSIIERFNGFNLGNRKNRAAYFEVTGDAIQEQGFWEEFKASGDARNSIMHGGKIAVCSEAEASLTATTALVAHLKK
ncbi:MAG: zinc ribbon domain-containing protein [Pseudomonadota bacterium]